MFELLSLYAVGILGASSQPLRSCHVIDCLQPRAVSDRSALGARGSDWTFTSSAPISMTPLRLLIGCLSRDAVDVPVRSWIDHFCVSFWVGRPIRLRTVCSERAQPYLRVHGLNIFDHIHKTL